jgi:hypothetical protein
MQQRLFIAPLTVFCSEIANFAKPENVSGQAAAWKTQIPGSTTNGTDFTRITGAGIMNHDGTPKIK